MYFIILGKMPRKVFKLERKAQLYKDIKFPEALSIFQSLERVLRLPSVASKRYLTNKVDRCVTGLVAQQQCIGPLHTPLADVAVTAISHFGYVSRKDKMSLNILKLFKSIGRHCIFYWRTTHQGIGKYGCGCKNDCG